MERILKVKQTAYPDGSIVTYLYGMTQPSVKNLGDIMKVAAYNYITREIKSPALKLESRFSIAG